MPKYIIRLDDACPNMNKDLWDKTEEFLNRHSVKPIVGIILDSRGKEFTKNGTIEYFWTSYALRWQNNGWIIAQHGLHHDLNESVRTEYAGKPYGEQRENLEEGYNILSEHGITPVCFFAPAHTFDDATIQACRDMNCFKFISDGVALYPYRYKDIMFLPNIFDTPHKILPFGIYTFVLRPNNMKNEDFEYLENFIKNNSEKFDCNPEILLQRYKNRHRSLFDRVINFLICLYRKIKGTKR